MTKFQDDLRQAAEIYKCAAILYVQAPATGAPKESKAYDEAEQRLESLIARAVEVQPQREIDCPRCGYCDAE